MRHPEPTEKHRDNPRQPQAFAGKIRSIGKDNENSRFKDDGFRHAPVFRDQGVDEGKREADECGSDEHAGGLEDGDEEGGDRECGAGGCCDKGEEAVEDDGDGIVEGALAENQDIELV
jgi:hypothetical protein